MGAIELLQETCRAAIRENRGQLPRQNFFLTKQAGRYYANRIAAHRPRERDAVAVDDIAPRRNECVARRAIGRRIFQNRQADQAAQDNRECREKNQ